MDLNQFKDPTKLGNTAKLFFMIFAFSASIGLGYTFDTAPQLQEIEDLKTKESELRTVFLDKKKQAVNLEAHKKQLKEIEISFGELLRQLPNKSEMDALLNDVNQSGVGQGLTFDLFRPSPVEKMTEFYAEQPVNISVTGDFADFGSFAEQVSKLSRIVNMDEITLKPKTPMDQILKGTSPTLTMDAVVRTYRYLDSKEIEAQKAASAKGRRPSATN